MQCGCVRTGSRHEREPDRVILTVDGSHGGRQCKNGVTPQADHLYRRARTRCDRDGEYQRPRRRRRFRLD